MKLLQPKQIIDLEKKSVTTHGQGMLSLMEKASYLFFRWLMRNLPLTSDDISIYVGKGNNGADGLCIAYFLAHVFKTVKVVVVEKNLNQESLWYHMYHRAMEVKNIKISKYDSQSENNVTGKIVIDAIFGIGLNRKASGIWEKVILELNSSKALIYSVDCPSGLYENSNPGEAIIKAHATLKFFRPLPWFYYNEHAVYLGNWDYLPIGLDLSIADRLDSSYHQTTHEEVGRMINTKNPFAHKGTYGHALIYAADATMRGATCLAIKGTMSGGAGKITLVTNKEDYGFYQSQFPEIICRSVDDMRKKQTAHHATCIGPGLGEKNDQLIYSLLNKSGLIVDADGLNAVSRNNWIDKVKPGTIITPHIGEFKRLFSSYNTRKGYVHRQREESKKRGIFIILKGRYTSISDPLGNVYFNSSGNEGMATAGSGDVLSGLLTSILARIRNPLHACLSSVYIHGFSGDLTAIHNGRLSMTASNIAESIPEAINNIIEK